NELENDLMSISNKILCEDYKSDEEKTELKLQLAEYYCLREEVTDKLFGYDNILDACKRYIHSTEDCDYEEFYEEIIDMFLPNYVTPIDKLSDGLKKYITEYPDMVKNREEEFEDMFGEELYFKFTPMSRQEMRTNLYLKDLEICFSAMEYEKTMNNVLEIARSRGDLEQIIGILT